MLAMPTANTACAIRCFRAMIEDETLDESAVRSFLEIHTDFMPVPSPRDQHLHLNSVIAEMPFGDLVADYAYLTRSEDEWRLAFVKLGNGAQRIFAATGSGLAFTTEFLQAIETIGIWKEQLGAARAALHKKLTPLLIPEAMAGATMRAAFVLIAGRSSELDTHEARYQRVKALEQQYGLRVLTYDAIIRQVATGYAAPKAVLHTSSHGYRLQSVQGLPELLLAHVMPQDLELSPEAEAELRAKYYDIDAWNQNHPLIFNEKWAMTSDTALMEASGLHPGAIRIITRYREKMLRW